MTNETTESKACRDLANSINVMTFSNKDFLKQFDREHRYLQSQIFQLALDLIAHCASKDYGTDGRNEWCQVFAKEIVSNNPNIF